MSEVRYYRIRSNGTERILGSHMTPDHVADIYGDSLVGECYESGLLKNYHLPSSYVEAISKLKPEYIEQLLGKYYKPVKEESSVEPVFDHSRVAKLPVGLDTPDAAELVPVDDVDAERTNLLQFRIMSVLTGLLENAFANLGQPDSPHIAGHGYQGTRVGAPRPDDTVVTRMQTVLAYLFPNLPTYVVDEILNHLRSLEEQHYAAYYSNSCQERGIKLYRISNGQHVLTVEQIGEDVRVNFSEIDNQISGFVVSPNPSLYGEVGLCTAEEATTGESIQCSDITIALERIQEVRHSSIKAWTKFLVKRQMVSLDGWVEDTLHNFNSDPLVQLLDAQYRASRKFIKSALKSIFMHSVEPDFNPELYVDKAEPNKVSVHLKQDGDYRLLYRVALTDKGVLIEV